MVQYFCAIRGLQQCKHCPVTLIQNEQGGVTFPVVCFQGGVRLEGVLRGEDHHDEAGHQELLRRTDSLGGGDGVFLIADHAARWRTTLTMRTNYLHH